MKLNPLQALLLASASLLAFSDINCPDKRPEQDRNKGSLIQGARNSIQGLEGLEGLERIGEIRGGGVSNTIFVEPDMPAELRAKLLNAAKRNLNEEETWVTSTSSRTTAPFFSL